MEITDTSTSSQLCPPTATLPAWWSGFLFHVLNPRQVSIFLYLRMLIDEKGLCSPTVEQIREDLGLYSTSMVFEALAVLEDLGFIRRERQTFPGLRPKRNVYRVYPCEMTLRRLLERNVLDGALRPARLSHLPASPEARMLIVEGLRALLGEDFERYERSTPDARREVLMELLDGEGYTTV